MYLVRASAEISNLSKAHATRDSIDRSCHAPS